MWTMCLLYFLCGFINPHHLEVGKQSCSLRWCANLCCRYTASSQQQDKSNRIIASHILYPSARYTHTDTQKH